MGCDFAPAAIAFYLGTLQPLPDSPPPWEWRGLLLLRRRRWLQRRRSFINLHPRMQQKCFGHHSRSV